MRVNAVLQRLKFIYLKNKYKSIKQPEYYTVASPMWLAAIEKKYDGYVTGVKRNKVSDADPRSKEEIEKGGMTGGDRMFIHGYGDMYSTYLENLIHTRRDDDLTIVEVGILKGNGIAMWSEVFPNARIIGLDIDLSHTMNNLGKLKENGAFKNSDPELYVFDQFSDNRLMIKEILKGTKINVMIDDGFHSDETIIKTFDSVKDELADDFVYFIEDSVTAYNLLKKNHPDYSVNSFGELTVVHNNRR